MLGLALGAKTKKMHQGHHGANHPVQDRTTGKVEITSMNHGFAVDAELAARTRGDACLAVRRLELRPRAHRQAGLFSVQYHPEASPGPQDSHYLFTRFVKLMRRSFHYR
jgi:carbamoyl-phosphate synthase small subunit